MLDELINQMKQMVSASREQMDQLRAEAEKDGIRAVCNGHHQLLDLHIPAEYLLPERKEELEDLLVTVLNEAIAKAGEQTGAAMKGLAGDIIPPGLDGLF